VTTRYQPRNLAEALDYIAELQDELAFLNRQISIEIAEEAVQTLRTRLHIQPQEARLLAVLHSRRGRIVSFGALEDIVWPDHDIAPVDGLKARACTLRRRLDELGWPAAIQTAVGTGYRLDNEAAAWLDGVLQGQPLSGARRRQVAT